MPKLKTHKMLSSRIKKTKTGKFIRRKAGQGHFNSRDTGKAGRNKKTDMQASKANHKAYDQLLPYA